MSETHSQAPITRGHFPPDHRRGRTDQLSGLVTEAGGRTPAGGGDGENKAVFWTDQARCL